MRQSPRALLGWLRAEAGTLPEASPAALRAARIAVALATLWIALASTWEIAAPFAAGHYAAATAVFTSAENMWRWGVLGPVPYHTLVPPQNGDFYCHHPWGVFWTAALFVKLMGHHDWVCRLPAVLMSTSMPPLLYALGRALWGPVGGAAAALSFVVLPIVLSFASFFALEVPLMFGLCLGMWGYVRLLQTGRTRFSLLALGGLLYAMNVDWAAFIFAALLLPVVFVRCFALRGWFAAVPFRRVAAYFALSACLAVATAGAYAFTFAHLGQLEQLLRQGEFRSAGSAAPLADVLASRRTWIALSFTPLAIALGKVAAPVLLGRFVVLRRDGEWLPLAVLGMALFQYLFFKQGADVHIFWPHYFALYFALAMGALARTLEAALARLAMLSGKVRWQTAASFVSLAFAFGCAALIAPDGVRALVFAHETGGRFNEKGSIIHPDIDKAAALAHFAERIPSSSALVIHSGMKHSYWMDWVLGRPVRVGRPRVTGGGPAYYAVDARFASPSELEGLLARDRVTAVGPFWFAERGARAASLSSFRIEREESGLLARYFSYGSHSARRLEPDAWSAWELGHHYGGPELAAPAAPPHGFEALRAAHNHALSLGDRERAAALLAELLRGTDRTPRCRYDDSSELLGVRFEPGESDVLTVYLRAGQASALDRRFGIEAIVEEAPALSLVPADPVVRDVGLPSVISPARWKPGYVYSTITEILKRPGRERFVAGFRGPGAPEPQGCSPEQSVLVLGE